MVRLLLTMCTWPITFDLIFDLKYHQSCNILPGGLAREVFNQGAEGPQLVGRRTWRQECWGGPGGKRAEREVATGTQGEPWNMPKRLSAHKVDRGKALRQLKASGVLYREPHFPVWPTLQPREVFRHITWSVSTKSLLSPEAQICKHSQSDIYKAGLSSCRVQLAKLLCNCLLCQQKLDVCSPKFAQC